MNIDSRIENGKAYLQFTFSKRHKALGDEAVLIRVKDEKEDEVLRCYYPLSEEEPAVGILLYPHLWKGPQHPDCYKAEAYFVNRAGLVVESCCQVFALYTFREIPQKGYFLNDEPFVMKAVKWDLETKNLQETERILELLYRMGANTILLTEEQKKDAGEFLQCCMQRGFLVISEEVRDAVPACSKLFAIGGVFPGNEYYLYKAGWSKEPFIHLCADSVKKQKNNLYCMKVYSNQGKAALYVDGKLSEFLKGSLEYLFEDIRIEKFPAVVTVQTGEYCTAVTLYESSQNFHSYFTFS